MLTANNSKPSRFEFPDPPGREVLCGSGGLLEIKASTSIWPVVLEKFEEIGRRLTVRVLEPSSFDLDAKEPGVIALLTDPGPVQTKSGCFINCR
jgi:hypothetical protein